jgi:capsular exopolysaccharide synthesis family protein
MAATVLGKDAPSEKGRASDGDGSFDLEFDAAGQRPTRSLSTGRELPNERLVSLLQPQSIEAEQYRMLRHRVEQRRRETGAAVFAVTSATGGEGKTTTAINLAGSLAQAHDARILLVDADLRRPSIAPMLGCGHGGVPGLTEAIRHGTTLLGDVVRVRQRFNLHFVPAGALTAPPYELLKSPRFGELLSEARRAYDYVIVDTPPVVPCPDYALVEKCVDAGLLVVTAHRTNRRLLEQALQAVDVSKLLGIVFNEDDSVTSRYHYGGYALARTPRLRSGRRD